MFRLKYLQLQISVSVIVVVINIRAQVTSQRRQLLDALIKFGEFLLNFAQLCLLVVFTEGSLHHVLYS